MPSSDQIGRIPVRESDYDSDDPYRIIRAIVDAKNVLIDYGAYTHSELPRELCQSYYVDYYLTQVTNGGHTQFALNSALNAFILRYITDGLIAMSQQELARLFDEIVAYITQEEHRKARFLKGGSFIEGKLDPWISAKDREFYSLQNANRFTQAHYDWLHSRPWVQKTSDRDWKHAMAEIIGRNPLREERLQALGVVQKDFLTELAANAPLKKTPFEYAQKLAREHRIELPSRPVERRIDIHNGEELSNFIFDTPQGYILIQIVGLTITLARIDMTASGMTEIRKPPLGSIMMERIEV